MESFWRPHWKEERLEGGKGRELVRGWRLRFRGKRGNAEDIFRRWNNQDVVVVGRREEGGKGVWCGQQGRMLAEVGTEGRAGRGRRVLGKR